MVYTYRTYHNHHRELNIIYTHTDDKNDEGKIN